MLTPNAATTTQLTGTRNSYTSVQWTDERGARIRLLSSAPGDQQDIHAGIDIKMPPTTMQDAPRI